MKSFTGSTNGTAKAAFAMNMAVEMIAERVKRTANDEDGCVLIQALNSETIMTPFKEKPQVYPLGDSILTHCEMQFFPESKPSCTACIALSTDKTDHAFSL
jgi:hypothetical protein